MSKINLALILLQEASDNGGATVNKFGYQHNRPGYVVGGIVPSLVLPNALPSSVATLTEWLTNNDAPFYGSWRDSETGLVHVDAVEVCDYRATAMILGRERGEIAIWDTANACEIRL